MALIERHNDESVREGYIRNGGNKVKLFTSALEAFQCNNRVVMTQWMHLDDFLPGRIIGRMECRRTQLEVSEELGIAQSVVSRLWQRFLDDDNVSRCNSTGRRRVITPNEDRYIFGSYCQKKQTEHSIRPVSSALFSYQYEKSDYRAVILEQHVRLFWGAMGAEFLFLDDNARPHRANIVDECLQSEDITRMDWLAYSPGLESSR
ncbi:uncharacterized protein TNCV_2521931 [Trichonephila clavipes]|nr:uncharacterized protein TNCV_2521931 [Trichonephila clavipes]